jgi:RNA polymerase sigma factor (sigma-70 family)
MARRDTLLRFIDQMAGRVRVNTDADTDLLERFVATRDNHSFAALVDRHGKMVLQVCLRVLGHSADAEDAAQAVFLVLARKAGTLRDRQALPAWLFGVARRTALKARAARASNRQDIRPPTPLQADPCLEPVDELSGREFLSIVDEEIQRLPTVYRLPMILCCVEGRSIAEAARQLCWSQGSVRGRLERARERLHKRLVRRGLTLAVGVAAIDLSGGPGIAAAAARLFAPISLNASALADGTMSTVEGVTAGASTLAQETLKAIALPRYAVGAIVLLAMGAISAGIILVRNRNQGENNGPAEFQPARVANAQQEVAPKLDGGPPVDEEVPIRVSGRVLQPDGQPCANAALYVGLAVRRYGRGEESPSVTLPFRGTTGADGRFQFSFTRSQLNLTPLDDAHPALGSVAKGYGFGYAIIPDWQTRTEVSVQLVEDRPISGRILDHERKPVADLKVTATDVVNDALEDASIVMWKGALPGQPELRTDADGRFQLHGIGRNRSVNVGLEGVKTQPTGFSVKAGTVQKGDNIPNWYGDSFEHILGPPGFTVKGVVRDRKTKLPIPGVALTSARGGRSTFTDANGHYEITGYQKANEHRQCIFVDSLRAPYFPAGDHLPPNVTADTFPLDFELESGIILTGKVINAAKGKPPSAAIVSYHALPSNASPWRETTAIVKPDGTYSLAVVPGPGLVYVSAAPPDAYAEAAVDRQAIDKANGEPVPFWNGDIYIRASNTSISPSKNHLIVPINPDEKTQSTKLDLQLQPARYIQGQVVDPDGKPVDDVECSGLNGLGKVDVIKGGSFTVLALNGQSDRDLCFRQAERKLGRIYHLSRNAQGPLRIELYPYGAVTGHLVDPAGKPMADVHVPISGPRGVSEIANQYAFTNKEGAFRLALLPDVQYAWHGYQLTNVPGEIEVRANETKDLGKLIMAATPRPPPN